MKKIYILFLVLILISISGCTKNIENIELFHPMSNDVNHSKEDILTYINHVVDEMPIDPNLNLTYGLDIIDRSYYDFYQSESFDIGNNDDFISVKAYLEYMILDLGQVQSFIENEFLEIDDQRKVRFCLEDEALRIETLSAYAKSNQFFHHITYIDKDEENRIVYDKLYFEYELDQRNLVMSGRESFVKGKSTLTILIDHKHERFAYELNDYETMSFFYYSNFISKIIKYKDQESPFEYIKIQDKKELTLYKNHRVFGYFDMSSDRIEAKINLLEVPSWNQLVKISIDIGSYRIINDNQMITDTYATIGLDAYHLPYVDYIIPLENDGNSTVNQDLNFSFSDEDIISAFQQFESVIDQALLDYDIVEDIKDNIKYMMEIISYYPSGSLVKKHVRLF